MRRALAAGSELAENPMPGSPGWNSNGTAPTIGRQPRGMERTGYMGATAPPNPGSGPNQGRGSAGRPDRGWRAQVRVR